MDLLPAPGQTPKDLAKGVERFLEILTQPTFPEAEVRKEVEQTLGLIRSAEEQPQEVAEKAFRQTLFLPEPYGHPVEGTEASLPKLTREALERFYRSYYHPNNAVLAIVGAVTFEEVQTTLLARLAAWPMGQLPGATVSSTFAPRPPRLATITIDKVITQASVTREDVYRVAQTYLHPDSALLVIVANLQEVGLE